MRKSLKEIFLQHKGKISDKWSLYLDEWDRLFLPYRDQPVRILEIGIQNGGSLEVWGKYFKNARKIVGCDISPECSQLRYQDDRISVVVGDVNSEACKAKILKRASSFDIIIDDGSHMSPDIVRSFALYFPVLRDNGIYVVEDMHSSYWNYFQGGLNNPLSAMSFFKRITDIVNYEHWRNNKSNVSLLDNFANEFGITFDPLDLAKIHSLEFINSLCIIRKTSPRRNILGERFVMGDEERITSGQKKFDHSSIQDVYMNIVNDANLDAFELIKQHNHLTGQVEGEVKKNKELSNRLAVKERAEKDLSARLALKEQNVQKLDNRLKEQDRAVQTLIVQVEEKAQAAQTLAGLLSDKDKTLQALSAELARNEVEKNHDLKEYQTRLAEEQAHHEQIVRSLIIGHPNSFQRLTGFVRKLKRRLQTKRDLSLIAGSGLFEAQGYLAENADVAAAGIDPVLHYLRYGGTEGRDPGKGFCSAWYLKKYPDVEKSGVNPLIHYLLFGKKEGRLATPPGRLDDRSTNRLFSLPPSPESPRDRFSVFTICSKNFTAYALTLHETLQQFHPGVEFILFLCDELDPNYDVQSLPFQVIPLSELYLPRKEEMAERYNITEFNTAIKPSAFAYVLKKLGREKVIYLDPDILLLSPLQEVLDELSNGAECVLTPHILEPAEKAHFGDNKFLQYGIFNLGFIALRNSPEVIRILEWWGRRLVRDCVIDLPNGLFVDQKWVDLFPAFLKRVSILHHPGYNVAYWNLSQRKVELIDGTWYSNQQPLRFVHFSGHELDDPIHFSRHAPSVTRDSIGDLGQLVDWYHERLFANGHAEYSKLPYAYNWNGASGVNLHTPKPTGQQGHHTTTQVQQAQRLVAPPAVAERYRRQGGIRRLTSTLQLLRTAAKNAGGWSELRRKTLQAYREGGWIAIQQGMFRTRSIMEVTPVQTHQAKEKAPAWMTRILVVDWSTPRPDQDAGSLSTFNLIRTYVELGYDVTFIPSDLQYLGEYTQALKALGVRCLHREDIGSMQDFLRREGNDLQFVMLCRAPIAALYIPAVRQFASGAKIILNTIDVHFLREMREAELDGGAERLEKVKRVKEWELDIMQKCDVTIVLSSVELQMLQRELPHVDIRLLPLIYVDTTVEPPGFTRRQDFLFIGGFRHKPNIDAVEFFCDEILPLIHESLPEVKFHIVGSDPPPQVLELGERKGVVVHGFVKDVTPLFQECKLSVAPLRFGAGIKGKIATSLAYGVPVVATHLAVEGMDLEAGTHVLVADEPRNFADVLLKVYKSKKLWTNLSAAGREQVFATYSAAAIQKHISALMQSINPQHKQLDLYKLRSKSEYDLLKQTIAPDILRRQEIELKLIDFDREQFRTDGFCAVCGCESQFRTNFMYSYENFPDGKQIPNWREHAVCVKCRFTNRLRASLHIFLHQVKPPPSAFIYITEQATSLFRWLKERYPNLVGSEYFGESIPFGAEKDGIRNEDLTALTFASDTFDHILSFDVLEHVPDDNAALKEVYRCLKPGGTFLFSVPFQVFSAEKLIRASMKSDGTVEHYLPPEVHGNPVDMENGALCFRYFAWDLLQDMKAIGFEDPRVLSYWSRDFVYLGVEQFMLMATKPMVKEN